MLDQTGTSDRLPLLGITADVISAFVGKNSVHAHDLPRLIAAVYASLVNLAAPITTAKPVPKLKPAVPIKKSVTPEYIVSLEDGRRYKSMTRHLTGLGMTPGSYRAKWGLPADYPMVSPAYGAKRSELAKAARLGIRKNVEPAADTARSSVEPPHPEALQPVQERAVAEQPSPEEKRRGRRKSTASSDVAAA